MMQIFRQLIFFHTVLILFGISLFLYLLCVTSLFHSCTLIPRESGLFFNAGTTDLVIVPRYTTKHTQLTMQYFSDTELDTP